MTDPTLAALLASLQAAVKALVDFLLNQDAAPAGWVPVMGPEDYAARVWAAIRATDLKGLSPSLTYTVFHLETGGGRSKRGLVTLNATRNLSNRHKGKTWKGPTYFVSKEDADLRVYKSLEESVADFVQLMHDPLYRTALAASQAGDAAAYFHALKTPDPSRPEIGYSTQADYVQALSQRHKELGNG